jgi:hypothetical protein
MNAVADKPISVVPDTGTEQAARLAAEHTGNPGRWVRLDGQHTRHVQQPVEQAPLFKAPSSPVGQESPYWCALETSRSGGGTGDWRAARSTVAAVGRSAYPLLWDRPRSAERLR